MHQRLEALFDLRLLFGPYEQQQESAAACSQQLSADGSGGQRLFVHAIDRPIAHGIAEPAFGDPGFVQQRTELADIGAAR